MNSGKMPIPPTGLAVSAGKTVGFRIVLVLLLLVSPVLFFLTLESALSLFGYGHPSTFFIQSQIDGRTVYRDNPKFSWRFFSRALARPAVHQIIPADKAAGTMRIFVLGESAAMGDPDFSYGVSRMLETMLRQHHPGQRFEVINAAVTAINSTVILPIARECARLKPDYFIIFMGNNEVIGPYGPGTVFAPFMSHLGLIRASVWFNATRIGQLAGDIRAALGKRENAPQHWGGVDMFARNRLRWNDPRMEAVYDHFAANLADICRTGGRAGARVILCTVPVNLQGCPPFASLHRGDLSVAEGKEWETLYAEGARLEVAGQYEQARAQFEKAAAIDRDYADLHYRLARCSQALGALDQAQAAFSQARDWDALRFRADTRIDAILRAAASEASGGGVHLLDAVQLFAAASADHVPGEELFYDHVHMNFRGTWLLAGALQAQLDALQGWSGGGLVLTEPECAAHLAFTSWDRYRLEKEILERFKSPAFAGRLDQAVMIRRREAALEERMPALQAEIVPSSLRVYQEALAHDAGDWVLQNNWGMFLLDAAHDPAGAAEQFRAVLRLFPEDHLSRNNLGLAYAQQGKLESAVACFEEALRLKPWFTQAMLNLGEVRERQGDFAAALTWYSRAGASPQWLGEAYARQGDRLFQGKDLAGAARAYESALQHHPAMTRARNNLAGVLSQLGRGEEAVAQLREAVRLEPENPDFQNNLGAELLRSGRIEEAVDCFEKALKLQPGLASAARNLEYARKRLRR